MNAVVLTFGKFMVDKVNLVGGTALLLQKAIRESFKRPHYPALIIDQIYHVGVKSTVLVSATALCTGMVMALQYGYGLEKFGGKLYIPKLVALSIVKELGPIFTSLMLAARVGAGIASEIGSMKVTQQIDAIRALGTSPIKKIVIPRIVATVVCLPLLTIIANSVGIFGGMIVAVTELGMDADFYIQKVAYTVTTKDYMVGLMKTVVFGLVIGVTACYYGMTSKAGTLGVGIATTQSVVTSSIIIVISDFFLTKLFWVLLQWTS
ncbi:MAG: MlaE family ABC transporter permease [Bdellovibrionales bacterium]